MQHDLDRDTAIAVVGVSVLFPGSVGSAAFWGNILDGSDFMQEVPPDHWLLEDYYDPDPSAPGKIYARRGAFLPPVPFDPVQHGLPPRQLKSTDTAQLLALLVAGKVLDDAVSVQFDKIDRSRISVVLGVASATELVGQMAARIQRPHWVKALREAGLPESQVQDACDRIEATYPEWDESTFPGLLGNVVAGRIANRLDLGGTNCVIDAACASSLGAVAMAVQELELGHSDLVITGGVDTLNDTFMYMCFSKTPALSPTGDCRPFSESADGTLLGEGIGMLALRRLTDAERDGDRIYAVLRGVGSSSDGRAKSIYAPRAEGQERAIRRAYERAGYGPGEVGLLEAHGTATKAGDVAEFEGLSRAFAGAGRDDVQWCALGSIKSQIGHTKAAAGTASLFKVVMALHHRVLPPTIKVDRPNPRLDIERSPFYLNTRTRPWIQSPHAPRRAGVSSFGFGGSNFHVTLEEYDRQARRRLPHFPLHLLLLGADDGPGLIEAARTLRQRVDAGTLPALARESQEAFDAAAGRRLAVLAPDAAAAAEALDAALERLADADAPFSIPNRVHHGVDRNPGRLAFLFPGQGSQYVEMGAGLAMGFDAARRVWDDHADCQADPGLPLHRVVFPPPAFDPEAEAAQQAALRRTDRAQPALGLTSLSMLALLERIGLRPDAVAGHSYGELVALHAAGAIADAGTLLELSRQRGLLMQAAASERPGAMLAVRAAVDAVAAHLDAVPEVTVANYNSPRQLVLAGPEHAVEVLRRRLTDAGVTCQPLPVATAFHTELVAACAEPLRRHLGECPIRAPGLPVYANTDAVPYGDDPEAIRDQLANQLARPVRFADQVERMYADGCRIFLEVGAGSVLTGLVADCLGERPHVAVALDRKGEDGRAGLFKALAVLSARGVPVDYGMLWREFEIPVPFHDADSQSAATVMLTGTNHGKPYPPPEGVAALPPANPEPAVRSAEPSPPSASAALAPSPVSGEASPPASSGEPPAVRTPAQGPAAPPPAAAVDGQWGAAFQAMQQQTFEAQQQFMRVLAESHQAFLDASEAAFAQLGRLAGGSGSIPAEAIERPMSAPAATVTPAAPPSSAVRPSSALPLPAAAAPAPSEKPAPEQQADRVDHEALLLSVVAEKTGYPESMLSRDMELEAGLGIDSIKRVEILSELQERVPELADVDTGELAALATLGEIIDFAGRVAGAPPATDAVTPPAAPAVAVPEAVSEVSSVPDAVLEHLELRQVNRPATGLATPGLFDADPLYLVADGSPTLAERLADRLRGLGVRAEVTAGVPEDARAVLAMFESGGGPSAATASQVAVFERLKALAPAMTGGGGLLILVGIGIESDPAEAAWAPALAAAGRTVAREWPGARVRVIDVPARAAEVSAAWLAEELLAGGSEPEVVLTGDGRRQVPELHPAGTDPVSAAWDPQGVLVVSGGARGVTAACLEALLESGPMRLAILGRTEMVDDPPEVAGLEDDAAMKQALLSRYEQAGESVTPQMLGAEVSRIRAVRELRRHLDRFASLGAEVRYHAVDVSDGDAVAATLDRVRAEQGPIRGLVHAAGVLADKPVAGKTVEQFRRVVATKLEGLRHLLTATRDDALTHLICFSSVAAVAGNAGQLDYAMANAVLGRVCAAERTRRGPDCLVKAIAWGPWDGGMVDASLARHFRDRGVGLIPLAGGARWFAEAFRGRMGDGTVVVCGVGLEGFSAADAPESLTFDVAFDPDRQPYLDSHRIRGRIVVPMVEVHALAVDGARALLPGRRITGSAGLEVRRGITLDEAATRYRLHCTRVNADAVSAELLGADGECHYRLQVLASRATADAMPAGLSGLAPWSPSSGQVYDGRLFHGPALQVIESLEGISQAGGAGWLRARDPGLPGPGLPLDVLDGGLQLAVLWVHEQQGGESLPTGFERLTCHGVADPAAPVHCEAVLQAATDLKSTWNLVYRTATGEPIVTIEGLVLHRLVERAAAAARG